ncbi:MULTISPECIES: hypothetical protein [unclassified Streptomyces]|uniref:hypothetical protein n=1 Tax=unclassified Streptomyces TaxID=2593676 RepID=UPI002033BC23|nr:MULTISPECIES: hypothetical protein [unclassified Streptomyces]MCM2423272.1 hypothetical protein [Streptomyces sp. RKAG293]MCM2424517.1 hypothetical protein [Streptomyces sp. RKAG337]
MGTTEWTRDSGGANDGAAWRVTRGGTIPHGSDVPVYAALADQWRSAGRMVPGQIDAEWAELVGRIPRLTGV